VRKYCADGRIEGAFLTGKTWNIPSNAIRPERANGKKFSGNPLLNALKEERDMNLKGGIYHKTQVNLTYNSNHIEGSRLSEDQTRLIFETNTIGVSDQSIGVDDVVETINHFGCVGLIIDEAKSALTETLIKKLHFLLKSGTSDSRKNWFNVGEYKARPNEVGGSPTCPPEKVADEMKALLTHYREKEEKTIEDIIAFHVRFESIHPFQDGNGRVGRLILFKECLRYNIVPFIIDEEHKGYYYRGLKEWKKERGFLLDTCLDAQDRYKEWLGYFNVILPFSPRRRP
jgi:Fic family protein